jgi:homoserine dehydrogenase
MSQPLRIAIAGLGTVGIGVIRMIEMHGEQIASRAGRAIEISAIHAKDKSKKRAIDVSKYRWIDDIADLPSYADVVVEVIGGDSVAKSLIEFSLTSGKHVVTANKALLARHGLELAKLAEQHKVGLNYEASVAGGIPIIKALREGFAGNEIKGLYGILNGTCNYILTQMRTTGRDFGDVLKEAQNKGYAEADPTFDVDGIDAAHKLSILTSLAFGVQPDFDAIDITGIRHISAADIDFAQELGFRIKLLGIARRLDDGKIVQSLEPCMVPLHAALSAVEGVYNAVYVEGDFVGNALLEGRGAGEGPTASAVLSDLIDLARSQQLLPYGIPAASLKKATWAGAQDIVGPQYINLTVLDQPGVIADVAAVLRDSNISIETMIQRGRAPGQAVSVVITTHDCSRAYIREAMEKIENLSTVVASPTVLRIEQF